MAINKNQRQNRGKENPMYAPDKDCLRKFNYSNGAGWRTKNTKGLNWSGKRKKRG
jgi:hypothetical protein